MNSPSKTPESAVAPSLAELIVATPGVCGGKPRIAGTRIKVKHVYVWVEELGMTPAQVVAEYPHLTRAQVHAALAYYWSHRDEIHKDIENEEKLVAELKAKSGPSKLQERLTDEIGKDDPLPFG
jgi:uncharacterized protein (DUF433 family)